MRRQTLVREKKEPKKEQGDIKALLKVGKSNESAIISKSERLSEDSEAPNEAVIEEKSETDKSTSDIVTESGMTSETGEKLV